MSALYGIMVINDSNGPLTNRIHKKLSRAFRFMGFKVDIRSNIHTTDFLDVTFDLKNGSYKPYSKDDQTPTYVHIKSNHPKAVLRQIPISINSRISRNSSSQSMFNISKDTYQAALLKSGHSHQLTFLGGKTEKTCLKDDKRSYTTNKNKNRSRKVVWFNPPYCKLSNINIGREFLKLIDKNFPKEHPLHKICNRNCLKISYSCTHNMDNIINAQNKKLLTKHNTHNHNQNTHNYNENRKCNCRTRSNCPLNNHCLQINTVYLATIYPENTPSMKRFYIGICKGSWKKRWYVHNRSFSVRNPRNWTALAKHHWALQDQGRRPIVKWSVIAKAKPPDSLDGKCYLCLEEKFRILTFRDRANLLNKRGEMMSKCRHLRSLIVHP